MPQIALSELERGLDSYSLRILAIEEPAPAYELKAIFLMTLHELNISIPERNTAIRLIACRYATEILNESVTPYEGARKIVDELHYLEDDPSVPELEEFVSCRWQYEDFLEERVLKFYGLNGAQSMRDEIEKEILEAARKLVADAA